MTELLPTTDTTDTLVKITGQYDPATLASAVDARNAQAAPADEVVTWLRSLESRIAAIEAVAGTVAPAVQEAINAALPVAEVLAPGAAPVLAMVPALESTLNKVLTALGVHFSGKIANLPTSVS